MSSHSIVGGKFSSNLLRGFVNWHIFNDEAENEYNAVFNDCIRHHMDDSFEIDNTNNMYNLEIFHNIILTAYKIGI